MKMTLIIFNIKKIERLLQQCRFSGLPNTITIRKVEKLMQYCIKQDNSLKKKLFRITFQNLQQLHSILFNQLIDYRPSVHTINVCLYILSDIKQNIKRGN